MATTPSFSLEALKQYRAIHGPRRLRAYIESNLAPLVRYLSCKYHENEDHICAALAEMLALVFLRSEGFAGLGFIGRGAGKTADLSASRGGLNYAFEVCSARTAEADLSVDFLELKYDKKIRQARASGKKGGLDRAGLILVSGPPSFSGFKPDGRLAGLARGLYERKSRPPATHICLLAGGRAAVFPGWEG